MSEPRKMKMWATWFRADYGQFGHSANHAIELTVQAAGEGWTWPRLQSVGWIVAPVTIQPGHGES